MTDAEQVAVHIAEAYYVKHTGKPLLSDQRDKLLEIMSNGIAATHIMDAVDAAVIRHGMCGTQTDYFETVLNECRKTWSQLYGKAAP